MPNALGLAYVIPRVITTVASVLLTLLVVEIGLRVVGFDPLGISRAAVDSSKIRTFLRVSELPELDYDLMPGFAGVVWDTTVRINSHGFRGRDYTKAKPRGVHRIVVIGDSITFGNGIAERATYPARLEALLDDSAVEVLNLGVGGYDTLQEVIRLETLGLEFDPDLVVLAYCINDAGVASPNRKYVDRLSGYNSPVYWLRIAQLIAVNRDRLALASHAEASRDDLQFARRNRDWITDVSADASVTERIARLRQTTQRSEPDSKHRFLPWYGSTARIGKLRFSFTKLARLAEAGGFPVTIVIVPHLDEGVWKESYAIAYAAVAHEATRVGFDVVDLHQPFRTKGFRVVRANPIHPNELGHRIMAEQIRAHIIDRELLMLGPQ